MKKPTTALTLMLALLMAASSLTGCGEKKGSTSASTPTDSTTTSQGDSKADPHAERYEISIASWDLDYKVDANKIDPLYQQLEDKFNIDIKTMNTTWDDYIQKIQTWAASGSMADISAIDAMGQPFYSTWVKEGIVKQVPSDLTAYPNLQAVMNMEDTAAYADPDGNYYCVPRPNYTDNALWGTAKGVFYRKDLFAAAGITAMPTSMDEMIADLKAVMALPQANSVDVGITAMNKAHLFVLMLGYAPEVACGMNYWMKAADGTYVPGIFTENTKAGLMEMNKLYKENVLDNDIPIIKGAEAKEKFLSGRALMYCEGVYTEDIMGKEWDQLHPDMPYKDCVSSMHPWKAADGNTYRFTGLSHWSESYFNGDMEDGKYQRTLELYDYLLSEEGLNLMRFGEEGKDYTRNGDSIQITRPIDEATGAPVPLVDVHPQLANLRSVVSWDGEFMLVDPAVPAPTLKYLNEEADWYRENTKLCDTDLSLAFLEFENKDRTLSDPTDELIKVVMSDDPVKAYDDMVSSLKKNGYDAAIASFNQAAKAQGK